MRKLRQPGGIILGPLVGCPSIVLAHLRTLPSGDLPGSAALFTEGYHVADPDTRPIYPRSP